MLDKDSHKVYAKIVYYIKLIDKKLNNFSADYHKMKKEAFAKKVPFDDTVNMIWKSNEAKPNIIEAVWGIKDNNNFVKINGDQGTLKKTIDDVKAEKLKEHFLEGPAPNLDQVKAYLTPSAEAYGETIVNLHKHALSFEKLFKEDDITDANQFIFGVNDDDTAWIDDVFKALFITGDENANILKKTLKIWIDNYQDGQGKPTGDFMSEDYKTGGTQEHPDPFHKSLIFKRKIIAKFLLDLKNNNANKVENVQVQAGEEAPRKFFTVCYKDDWITDANMKDKWKDVAYLEAQAPEEAAKPKGFLANAAAMAMKAGSALLDHLKECAKPFYNKDAPYGGWAHQVWNETNGNILISSEKGKTYEIEKKTGAIKTLDITTWTTKDMLKDTIKGIK
jgi:hypothetical protein